MAGTDLTWTNQTRRLGDLVPWPRNPRQIGDAEAERLKQSREQFDQPQVIVIGPGDVVYDGHQRLKVWADEWGPDLEVAVRVSSRALTEPEREQLTIWLHRGTAGDWDFEALKGWDTDKLLEWGFEEVELEAAGFELGGEEPAAPEAQIDRAAELQEKWQVKLGQVWQADEHFVICGDCREAETWERLLAVAKVDKVNGVFTSPPYAEQRRQQYGGVPVDEYVDWWEAVQVNVKANLAADGSFFVNIKPHCENGERVLYVFDLVLAMKRRWGWRFVDELCWMHQGVMGKWNTRFKNRFEPVYHFSARDAMIRHANVIQPFTERSLKDDMTTYTGVPNLPDSKRSGFKDKAKKSAVYDGALPGNVVEVSLGETAKQTGAYQAATFPVALPNFFIRAYSDEGDVWLDPFLGSGTTIVAAHNNNRRGLGAELLPKYVAVTLERLEGMGLEPRLAAQPPQPAPAGDG